MPVSKEAFVKAGIVIEAGVETALSAAKLGMTPGDVATLLVDSLTESPQWEGLDKDATIRAALNLVAVAVVQIAQDEMQMGHFADEAQRLKDRLVELGDKLGVPVPEDLR